MAHWPNDNNLHAIGFDADDTLWHCENLFSMTQKKFAELLSDYHEPEWIEKRLYETEVKNLKLFGYGIKGFSLSMIETALELSEGRIRGEQIEEILALAKAMLKAPVELLQGVEKTIQNLAQNYPLLLITKGDLFDQESKIARSGLTEYFTHIDIVSEKTPAVYAEVLNSHRIDPERFLFVGNSLRSDIFPLIELGAQAVHIPYTLTWQHEMASNSDLDYNYYSLEHIAQLPNLVFSLDAGFVQGEAV